MMVPLTLSCRAISLLLVENFSIPEEDFGFFFAKSKGLLKCFVLFCFSEIKEQSSLPKGVQKIAKGFKRAACFHSHPSSIQKYGDLDSEYPIFTKIN